MDWLRKLGNGGWEIKCDAAENCITRRHGRGHYWVENIHSTTDEVSIEYFTKPPRGNLMQIVTGNGRGDSQYLTVTREEFCDAISATTDIATLMENDRYPGQ